ncbi:phosphocholine-specific phospholipase C [Streptomyces tubercidicus]|uniref:phosphocholine-specific phospholipase C n=1 Tax=Streptomyces tubercidicus TaxID=47759 RepID=UPI003466FEF3
MAELSRRTFISMSASVAAGAAVTAGAVFGSAPTAGAQTAATAALGTTGTISDVQHVVILMQENRSFDHYFGTLKGVRGFGDRATIQLSDGYSVFEQPNGSGRQYPWPFNPSGTSGDPETLAQCNGDLSHAWSDQHNAWNGGKMDSWVSAKGTDRTLGYLQRADIPFHYALADNWTICDAYHCSVLSSTGPNRTYHWSGTIDPSGTAGGPAYDGADESGLGWETYAEALENAGVSWKVYQNANDNFGDNALAYFSQFTDASAGSSLADKGMGSVPADTGRTPDDIAAAIKADVLNGTLPQVSWIVADEQSSEHPYATPRDGAHFVHMVMDALNADPNVFNSTILLLNYDENDGFFDHVPPPAAPAGTTGEFHDDTNIGLGFRVPLIAVSPWSRGGWVNSETFDHTSVLRFLEVWTAAIGKPANCVNISDWRRKVCGDLTSIFDFANPVYDMPSSLPDTSETIGLATCKPLDNPSASNNALPAQEPGTRPARALPYQPNTNLDHTDSDADGTMHVWLKMSNDGAPRSAHFAAYANAHRSGGPWQYTVAPGSPVTDFFNCGTNGYGDGKYDLSVVGPNRFLRRFIGDLTQPGKDVAVTASYASAPDTGKLAVSFQLANTGTTQVTFTVTSNYYRTDGPWTYTVAAGGTSTSDHFDQVTNCNGWYDFTVTVDSDTSWSQRFTGHLETGSASVSG